MLTMIGAFISINFLYPLIIPGIIIGIAAIVASNFLPMSMLPYKLLFQIVGLILVLFFVYTGEKKSSDDSWKLKMAEVEIQNAHLRGLAAEVTIEIQTKYITKIKEVEKIRTEYVYIDRFITPEIDTKFPLPNAFIRLYNNSISGNVPNTTAGANATSGTPKVIIKPGTAP